MTGRLVGGVLLVVGGGADGPPGKDETLPIGNGRAIALACAREGAEVIVADRDKPLGQQTAAAICAEGGRALAIACDVADPDACCDAVSTTVDTFGKLTLLVNNVGIGGGGSVVDTDVEAFDRLYAVNLRSHFLMLKHAIPAMAACGGGAVVNISSTAALRPTRSSLIAYETTKAALAALTRGAAVTAASSGVRVNSVIPGLIDTTCRRRDLGDHKLPIDDSVLLGRLGTPWEVAAAVVFLLSGEASYITGTELIVDGGLTVPLG
jgi:NAD(P)-dependent dehydrogenase (short-subunit alcohol dehydrogenase family)